MVNLVYLCTFISKQLSSKDILRKEKQFVRINISIIFRSILKIQSKLQTFQLDIKNTESSSVYYSLLLKVFFLH